MEGRRTPALGSCLPSPRPLASARPAFSMPKGFHTQGLVVLLQSAPSLEVLRRLLSAFNIVKEGAAAGEVWMAGPSLIVAYRLEVNGYTSIDVVDRRWPDHIGNPKKEGVISSRTATPSTATQRTLAGEAI